MTKWLIGRDERLSIFIVNNLQPIHHTAAKGHLEASTSVSMVLYPCPLNCLGAFSIHIAEAFLRTFIEKFA